MKETGIVRVLLIMGITTLLLLGVVCVTLDVKAAEKIATALAMPCGVIWYLMIAVTVFAIRTGTQKLALMATTSLLIYSIAGNGFVAESVVDSLESDYRDVSALAGEPLAAVVVLGGGASRGANGRLQGNLSGDRVILAAQLYHSGRTAKLICTGKRIASMSSDPMGPADKTAGVLMKLGVPESAIVRIPGRNTYEEMIAIREYLPEADVNVGLVTSAWHLPRALRLAQKQGLEFQPLPADFISSPRTAKTPGEILLSLVPRADMMQTNARAAKEHLAMLVGR